MARGALRDDLYSVLIALTGSALEVSDRGATPAERVEQWFALNAEALRRAQTSLAAIDRMSHPGIAALSVALRTLRTVTRPVGAGLAPAVSTHEAGSGSANGTREEATASGA
jgi:glutamate dehydrogenase